MAMAIPPGPFGDGGELVWDDPLDFCPDSLWLQVTGQGPEAPGLANAACPTENQAVTPDKPPGDAR